MHEHLTNAAEAYTIVYGLRRESAKPLLDLVFLGSVTSDSITWVIDNFKYLMAFGMFILALLTFVFTFIR